MTTLITDPDLERRIRDERTVSGADRYDEVWEGTYMMAPMPNVEHQDIVNGFAAVFQQIVRWPGLGMVMPGVNVSDRKEGWEENYRVPDLAVFLHGGAARNCVTHWCGGPDFAVEVTSPNDQTRDKIPFYSQIGVRELLIVDRDPWRLELYRRSVEGLVLIGKSTLEGHEVLRSNVLPLLFLLAQAPTRPQIEMRQADGAKTWAI